MLSNAENRPACKVTAVRRVTKRYGHAGTNSYSTLSLREGQPEVKTTTLG